MARSHGRLLTAILNDEDFRTLSPAAQRLYFILLPQPDLNTAGVLSINYRRWAHTCTGTTEDDVRAAARELDERRYVLLDEDTEEAFIRSLMRRDGIVKQPQMLTNALRVARQVMSRRLRAELAAELRRIGMVITKEVADEIDPEGAGRPTPPPTPTTPNGGTERSPVQAPRSLPAASPEPDGSPVEGCGQTGGVGVGVGDVVSSSSRGGSVSARKRATRLPDDFPVTTEMVDWARREHPGVDGRRETAKFIDYWHAAAGQTSKKLDWTAAWRNWIRRADEHLATRPDARHLAPVPAALPADTDAAFTDLRHRGDAQAAARLAGISYVVPAKPPSDPTDPKRWRHARAVEWIDEHAERIRAALHERPAG